MGQRRPDANAARAFLEHVLHAPQAQGGRDLWGCHADGLITATELRDALLARLATWLSHANGVAEPSSDRWLSRELETLVERALFGEPGAGPARG